MSLNSPRPYFAAIVVPISDIARVVKERVIEPILIGRLVIGQHQAPNGGVAPDESVQRRWGQTVGGGFQGHRCRGVVFGEIGRELVQLQDKRNLSACNFPGMEIVRLHKGLPTSNGHTWRFPLPVARAR